LPTRRSSVLVISELYAQRSSEDRRTGLCPAPTGTSRVDALERSAARSGGDTWRALDPGTQALLTLAHLRKGERFADLAPASGSRRPPRGGAPARPSASSPPAGRTSPHPAPAARVWPVRLGRQRLRRA